MGRLLAAPGRELEGSLVGVAAVHRFAVRDDHELERKLEQGVQRGQNSLLVPLARPDAKLAARRRQPVREDERALFGQPERRLVVPSSVVEGDEAAG